jgi:hypothetical protein
MSGEEFDTRQSQVSILLQLATAGHRENYPGQIRAGARRQKDCRACSVVGFAGAMKRHSLHQRIGAFGIVEDMCHHASRLALSCPVTGRIGLTVAQGWTPSTVNALECAERSRIAIIG